MSEQAITPEESGPLGAPFVYPDPIYEPRAIDGAAFIYFDEPIVLTLPPLVVTERAFELVDLVERRQPAWGAKLHGVLATWDREMAGWQGVERVIQPLRDRYTSVWTAYPANDEALADVDDLIAAAGLALEDVSGAVDPVCACGELVLHIFLESWLERDEDVEKLYAYCERIFTDGSLASLLLRSYFFRTLIIARFQNVAPVLLLNNPRLAPLLQGLPIEPAADTSAPSFDPITWEFFRQILSPHVDPLDHRRAEALADIYAHRSEELKRYRKKCERLADEVRAPVPIDELTTRVARFVRDNVADEIADLLRLNRRARDEYIASVLEDEKTWAATLGAAAALASGHVELSVGAGIGGVASLGAKALRAARERRETLRTSDFRIVYRINHAK